MVKYDLGYDEELADRAINSARGDAYDQGTGCAKQFDGLVSAQGPAQWGYREPGPLGFQKRYMDGLSQIKAALDSLSEDLTRFAAGLQACQNSLAETEGDITAGQEALQLSISSNPAVPAPFTPVAGPGMPKEI